MSPKPDGTPTNPGRTKSVKAARQVDGETIFPKFQDLTTRPTDFNDLHCLEGLQVVTEQLTQRDKEAAAKQKGPSYATMLVDICEGIELFHTPDKEGFATIPTDGHFETWSLKSEGFKQWLLKEFFYQKKSVPGSQAIQDALCLLTGRACYAGEEREVFLRIGCHEKNVYLDLANKNWEVAKISPTGWEIIKNPPLRFRRPRGMLPLPNPVHGVGDTGIGQLRPFLNVGSEEDFMLAVAWLINCYNPSGPYLVLVLYGEQGTAKSTMVKILRSLIDPNSALLRREPKNADDLMVAAKNNWTIVIDNMSFLRDDLSDDLCRLATEGALSKREHYSNDEEFVLNAKRPIILNGIDEFVTRGDLTSRAIMLNLPVISAEERKRERVFFNDFEAARPRILGALLTAVSGALLNQDSFNFEENLRMADAWHWVSAAETSFGWERGATVRAFYNNQLEANEIVLNSSPIYPFIRQEAEDYGLE